jgi:hypothetical protein
MITKTDMSAMKIRICRTITLVYKGLKSQGKKVKLTPNNLRTIQRYNIKVFFNRKFVVGL